MSLGTEPKSYILDMTVIKMSKEPGPESKGELLYIGTGWNEKGGKEIEWKNEWISLYYFLYGYPRFYQIFIEVNFMIN